MDAGPAWVAVDSAISQVAYTAGNHAIAQGKSREPGGNRTLDQQIKSLLLYRLSYRPANSVDSLRRKPQLPNRRGVMIAAQVESAAPRQRPLGPKAAGSVKVTAEGVKLLNSPKFTTEIPASHDFGCKSRRSEARSGNGLEAVEHRTGVPTQSCAESGESRLCSGPVEAVAARAPVTQLAASRRPK